MIESVCIFCGSSKGRNSEYEKGAREYATLLATEHIKIVYGAGSTGIMGVVARAALEKGGIVIGIAPEFLHMKEVVHQGLSELHLVETMFERKEMLIRISDAFAVLPGGIGTLDEFFEVFTALQLEMIHKPIGILNLNGYYDRLVLMLEHMVEEGFFRKEHFEHLIIESDPTEFHRKLMQSRPDKVFRWVDDLRKKDTF